MLTLLQINSSLLSAAGQSSRLADDFVNSWRKTNPDGKVVVRDLAAKTLPHLTAERFQAFTTEAEKRTALQQKYVAESDELIEELATADIVVIGLPMYNFGIPSTLKAWIDHIARAGRTFKYTENGPVGLLKDRKTVLLATRGGQYAGTDKDTQAPYMKTFLNFIGINDIEFVYAEGLAMGADQQQHAIAKAKENIAGLTDVFGTRAA